jgi:hypothetical protein
MFSISSIYDYYLCCVEVKILIDHVSSLDFLCFLLFGLNFEYLYLLCLYP